MEGIDLKRYDLNAVNLTEEEKKKLKEEIAYFYREERDEELGVLAQEQILNFFVEKAAPVIYNKALNDANAWFKRQMDNLEADYFMLYKEEK